MTIVAGPSGSGKSILFPVAHLCAASFNVDDRAAALHGGYATIPRPLREQAQRECEAFVLAQIERRASFAVESTLRSRVPLDQAAAARAAGFTTSLIYACTQDVDENIQRVARRGRLGGHAAPVEEIRDIYAQSLANLRDCRALFDEAELYDSSRRWLPPVNVASLRNSQLSLYPPLPAWVPEVWRHP